MAGAVHLLAGFVIKAVLLFVFQQQLKAPLQKVLCKQRGSKGFTALGDEVCRGEGCVKG